MKSLLLLLLLAVAACACALLLRIARGRDRRSLMQGLRAPYGDAPDAIGISALCSGVTDPAQIENLLSPEYARYEVIVTLDARCRAPEFDALAARYRMIRVEWMNSGEFDVEGVRALGRSRKRRFRRLVLVDRAFDGAAGDYDAAASVAAYDYLLPVTEGQWLLPGAVERLVAELGSERAGSLDLVRSRLGEPAVLLAREAVVAAGGFGRQPLRSIPHSRRRTLWEPLLTTPGSGVRLPGWVHALGALLLAAAVVWAMATARWAFAATGATLALVWAAAARAAQLASGMAPSASGRLLTFRRPLRNLTPAGSRKRPGAAQRSQVGPG